MECKASQSADCCDWILECLANGGALSSRALVNSLADQFSKNVVLESITALQIQRRIVETQEYRVFKHAAHMNVGEDVETDMCVDMEMNIESVSEIEVQQDKKGTKRKRGEMDESSADDHRSNRQVKRRKLTRSRTQRRRRRFVAMSEDTSDEEDDGDDEVEEEVHDESTPDNSETETERKAWPSFMSNRRTRNQNKEEDDDDDHDEDEDIDILTVRSQHGADLTQVLSASNIATAARQYCAANRNSPILSSDTDCHALCDDIQQTKRKEIERDLGIELVQKYRNKLLNSYLNAMAEMETMCLKCNKNPHFEEWELLLCDYCAHGAMHCSCHEPMYCAVPATDWACPTCVDEIKKKYSEEYRIELTKQTNGKMQFDAKFNAHLYASQLKKQRFGARPQRRQRVMSNHKDTNRMNEVLQSLENIALPSRHMGQ